MPAQHNSPPHYWAILDTLPVALLYKDTASSAVYANKAALQLLALPSDTCTLSLSQLQRITLLHPENLQAIRLIDNPLLLALSGTTLSREVALGSAEKPELFRLCSTILKLEYTLSDTIIITLTPSDNDCASSQAELEELRQALAFDKLMSQISTQLINVSTGQLAQHVEDALAALAEFGHADRSYVFLFDPEQSCMSNSYEWVRQGISSHKAVLQNLPYSSMPYFYQQIISNAIFAINDIRQLPETAIAERQEFEAEGIRSVICVAMWADEQPIGFIGCDMVSRYRTWNTTDLRRMKLVGEMLANTIQSVRYRYSLQQIQLQLLHANKELQQQATQDGLTGIANRRHFDLVLQQELQRSARNKQYLGLIMLDIDRFKAYNDYYGHQAGDQALQQVASVLKQISKRQGELAARYGGEEFAVILPNTPQEACLEIARKIQQQINELAIPHQGSDVATYLTVSQGVYSCQPDKNSQPTMLIELADQALYQAKASGRNAICHS